MAWDVVETFSKDMSQDETSDNKKTLILPPLQIEETNFLPSLIKSITVGLVDVKYWYHNPFKYIEDYQYLTYHNISLITEKSLQNTYIQQ